MLDSNELNLKLQKKYSIKNPWKRFELKVGKESQLTSRIYLKWAKRFLNWAIGEDCDLEDEYTLSLWNEWLKEINKRPWLEEQDSGRRVGVRYKYKYPSRVIALTAAKIFMSRGLRVDSNRLDNVNELAKPKEKTEMKSNKILSEKKIKRVIASSEDCITPNCELISKLAFNLILRAADLVKIRSKDLDISGEKVQVSPVKGGVNRTHKVLDLPFSEKRKILSQLSELKDKTSSEYLFKNNCQDRPTASNSIRVHFLNQHNQSFHEFARHSAICWFINNFGFERAYLRARHVNYSMTTRYAEFTEVEPSEMIE